MGGNRLIRSAALAVVGVTAMLLAGAAPAHAKKTQGCGSLDKVGLGIYNIKAKNYKCGNARALANQWKANQFECVENGTCTFGLFTCVNTPIRSEDIRARCTNGAKLVTFERRL